MQHPSALALLLLALPLAGCAQEPAGLLLATTTSTDNTGLLAFLLPGFEEDAGARVKVVAVGTGRALELGARGDADVVLAHAPDLERAYLTNGSYVERREVMFNQFLLVGPPGDPARVRPAADVGEALRRIAAAEAPFVSRGDQSGTHLRERALWESAGFDYDADVAVPANRWYRAVGQGMGATLRIAGELQAYTLSDDGTFYATAPTGLVILRQDEPPLHNQYSVLLPDPARADPDQATLARTFADWLVEPSTQARIGSFEVAGHRLFTPNAGVVERR